MTNRKRLSRAVATGFLLVLGLPSAVMSVAAQDASPVDEGFGGVGLSFEEFEAVYGQGEQIDEIESYMLSAATVADPTMRVERYESERLAEVAGGRTGIMLAYQEQMTDGGAVVTRATVTIPTANDGTLEATGDPGGPGLAQDAWEAVYGTGTVSQAGVVYDNVTFPDPGSKVTVRYTGVDSTIGGLVFEYGQGSQLGGSSREDVLTQQLDAVPADAVYQGSYYLPPTPEGPIRIIIDRWESESLAGIAGGSESIIGVTQQISA